MFVTLRENVYNCPYETFRIEATAGSLVIDYCILTTDYWLLIFRPKSKSYARGYEKSRFSTNNISLYLGNDTR